MHTYCIHISHAYFTHMLHDTTDLRNIDENQLSGTVDALGSLEQLQELCVTFPCLHSIRSNSRERHEPFHLMVPRCFPHTHTKCPLHADICSTTSSPGLLPPLENLPSSKSCALEQWTKPWWSLHKMSKSLLSALIGCNTIMSCYCSVDWLIL